MQTSHEEIFEGNLKLAAFLPLLRGHFNRRQSKSGPRAQTNWTWPVPAIDVGMFGLETIITKISRLADRLRPKIGDETAENINTIAQLDLQLALILRQHGREQEALSHYEKAISTLSKGLENYRDSLLLHWNRAHWRLFFEGDLDASEAGFREILENFDGWRFEPQGSELGYAFSTRSYDPVFWEYQYGNLVLLAATKSGAEFEYDIRTFLRATATGYLAHIAERRGRPAEARALYSLALEISDNYINIRALQFESLLAEIESNSAASPECELYAQFRAISKDALLANPRMLLEHAGRMLALSNRLFDGAALYAFLHNWYRLRRIIGDSQNIRHFPQSDADFDMLIRLRPHWPPILSDAVAASLRQREGPGTSAVSDQLAARARG